MPLKRRQRRSGQGAALSRRGAAVSRRRLYAGALSAARCHRCRGRGAGMLSARAEAFRQLSRAGDEAVAVCHPAQCLPRRICPARQRADRQPSTTFPSKPARRRCGGKRRKRRRPQMLRQRDAGAIRRMVTALAEPFRETFVLREIHNLSYREIADVAEVPVGTVMSRLARARAMLRSAWTGGRGASRNDLRRGQPSASRADRRRTRRRPRARGRSPYRQLPCLRRRTGRLSRR